MNSNHNFETIDYLKYGNQKQKQAYDTLSKHRILERLHPFCPILVGTIPIQIDLEHSDLDIICHFEDPAIFKETIIKKFQNTLDFDLYEDEKKDSPIIVASFKTDAFEIEIFGQNIPTKNQNGYRHMLIENQILLEKGENFRKSIIELKRKGYKTEPAFAIELGLKGDPYQALLAYGSSMDFS